MVELGGLRWQRQREAAGCRRVVPQLRVLDEPIHGVDPEAVGAALEPKPDNVLHGRDNLGIAPVEVGLLRVEGVQVPAPAVRIAAPGGASEDGRPVVRRPVDRRPDVPVRVLSKPGVLDRGVRRNKVEQHPQAALMRPCH